MLLLCYIWIIDFSLLVHWRFVCDSLSKLWRYSEDVDASINDLLGFYWPNLRNPHVSSLLRRWLVDDSLGRHIWNIDNFDGNFFDRYCFFVLATESLTFHCWFIDESLMIFRRKLDVTAKISMQTLMIINVFLPNLRNIDVSLLLRRWSLLILWRDIFETLVISMAIFFIFIVFAVLNSESLMFTCWFIDDSLIILWRTIEVTAKISLHTLKIVNVFLT